DGNQAVLAAFAKRTKDAQFRVDVRGANAHQFRDSQACRVQQLEHSSVAQAQRMARVRRLQQEGDFIGAQKVGQLLPLARNGNVSRRVRGHDTLSEQKRVKIADAGQQTGD